MKYILSTLSFLIMTALSAEVIHGVEYFLPESAQEWIVANELETETGITRIYIPKATTIEESKEFFGINVNSLFSDFTSASTIEEGFLKMYPNEDIHFHVLQNDETGILYEWSFKKDGKESHGCGRAFPINQGTAVLNYQTEESSRMDEEESIWIPILKEAHAEL